jgi:hypothetical protein
LLARSLIVAPQSVQSFLTANWRYLALNYVVDAPLITPLLPAETESISKTVRLSSVSLVSISRHTVFQASNSQQF